MSDKEKVTYKLVIHNRYNQEVLTEYSLSFFTGNECEWENQKPQIEELLSELLDNLPKEKWTKEGIREVIDELMSESYCGYQYSDNSNYNRKEAL